MSDKSEKNNKKKHNFKLTKKNLKFLEFLAKGMKIAEAYKLSGYTGKISGAYTLKHKLRDHLEKLLEIEGFSRDRLRAEIVKLLNLPCEITELTFDQKKEVLKLLKDELGNSKESKPKISEFVILRSDQKGTEAKTLHGNPVNITKPLSDQSDSN